MKILFLLSILLMLVSCGSDSDKNTAPQSITGNSNPITSGGGSSCIVKATGDIVAYQVRFEFHSGKIRKMLKSYNSCGNNNCRISNIADLIAYKFNRNHYGHASDRLVRSYKSCSDNNCKIKKMAEMTNFRNNFYVYYNHNNYYDRDDSCDNNNYTCIFNEMSENIVDRFNNFYWGFEKNRLMEQYNDC